MSDWDSSSAPSSAAAPKAPESVVSAALRNSVQHQFALSGAEQMKMQQPTTAGRAASSVDNNELNSIIAPTPTRNTRLLAIEQTTIKKGCGYRLSYEHSLAIGRYTPDPSGEAVTKAVAPNRTTSAISVTEAEEAFRIGASGISRILVPPQSKSATATTTTGPSRGSGSGSDMDSGSGSDLPPLERSNAAENDDDGDNSSSQSSGLTPSSSGSLLSGGQSMSGLLNSMFRTASTSAPRHATKPPEPLSAAAQTSKQKNVRMPPGEGPELQETVSHFVVAMPQAHNAGPATLFFPVSYDWPRRRPAPGGLSPQELNKRDHTQWPPLGFGAPWLLPAIQSSPELMQQYMLSRGLSVPRPYLAALQLRKHNANTALLYRIGPGAVAFRVVTNAFEAAGMTYTPGGCADHVDYNDPGAEPPVASTSTGASWNVLWAKRCDPIVLSAMNSFQKINHLPGSWAIGRKDSLHKHIAGMQQQFGIEAFGEIAPRSFLFPSEAAALRQDVERSVRDVAEAKREARRRQREEREERKKRRALRFLNGEGGGGGGEEDDDEWFDDDEEEEEFEEEEDDLDDEDDENSPLKNNNNNTPGLYIVKPCASSCGNGIRVVRGMPRFPASVTDGTKMRSFVVQRYLEPFVVDQRKFDFRLYVVLTGVNPLKVWLFDDGLIRFAAHKYTQEQNLENPLVHLTNFSVGKGGEAVAGGEGDGGEANELKWTITDFRRHFIANETRDVRIPSRFPRGMPRADVWAQVQRDIDDVVVKTVLSMENEVRTQVKTQCRDPTGRGCFEMFGVDVMLDWNLKPHIIEANIMPSLAAMLDLDRAIKGRMLAHMLTLVGVVPFCREKERLDPTPPLGAFVSGAASSNISEPMYTYSVPDGSNSPSSSSSSAAAAASSSSSASDARKPTPENPYHYRGGENVPLVQEFGATNTATTNITDAERFMLAEAEGEVARAGGFRRIFPTEDSHDRYSHLFSHGMCRNTWLLVSHAVAVGKLKKQAQQQMDQRNPGREDPEED